ncbi:MAG TPA: Gfo/Idh/MocA family oxidoreductase [Bacteroidales bacterium]|nr:Gfo/Idh/MocA family oxidoreductase [Bacteroidales bacterium]
MLKIGVLGAGHLGKIHIRCIKQIPDYEMIGFYDPNETIAQSVESNEGVKRFDEIEALIGAVDVVDIVTPTVSHFDCAQRSLKKLRHVFIEKPIVATPEEAIKLIDLAAEAGVKVQVGHVERFNPAFLAAQPYINNPMFIEAHRLSQFNPRGTDVPVVLDLMIHDIDIVMHVVKSNVRRIHASGVAVVSDTPDIANARIEFENGCVANITASRISMKSMRKSRFFQRDSYIAVNFLEKDVEIIRMDNLKPGKDDPMALVLNMGPDRPSKQLFFEKPKIPPINAIVEELKSFHTAILNNKTPPVTINDGYVALEIAHQIIKKIDQSPVNML